MVRLLALVALLVGLVVSGLTWWQEHPAAGRFRIEGTTIIGPDDEPFVPTGVNLLGPHGFFNPDGVTAGHAQVLRDAWNLNTVRINACLPDGCPYTEVRNSNNDDLDAIVDEYTEAGLVVMIAMHEVTPGLWPDEDTLARMTDWWTDVALRYADEPYVWFNLLNEPGSGDRASPRWLEIHRQLLAAVRGTGAGNLVVVDGTSWGQEAGGDSSEPVDSEDSAILTYGAELKGTDDALAFSFHAYDQWAAEGEQNDVRDGRMLDFVWRVHAAGHAVLIGETGTPANEPCCDTRSLGTAAAYRVAEQLGIGILAWHGQGIDGFQLVDVEDERSSPSAIDDHDSPTNLTWHGRLLWDLAHGR